MSDDRLERIEAKLDRIVGHLGSVDITLAKQEVSLAEHIKRSNMLEDKLIPVESHVHMVNGALKLIGLIGAITAILATVWQVFK